MLSETELHDVNNAVIFYYRLTSKPGIPRYFKSTLTIMKLRVQLQCKNLHEYLRELSPDILDKLYNHPATCLAVYRELPSLAKNYVMRMLFLDQPLPQAAVALWVKKDSQKDHDECVSVLAGLRLWHSQQLQGGLQGYILNPVFKDNLRIALLGGGRAWADEGSTLGPDRHARDIESLDRYAMERWEVILHFMVGSPSAAVSQDLAQLLVQAGLMKSEAGEAPYITSAGFQFLLLDTASQLWYFTLQYLKTAQLSYTEWRDNVLVSRNTSVFRQQRKSRRYYPTRLAITLAAGVTTSSPSSSSSSSSSSNLASTPSTGDAGFIVVETNYRIYAYTNSELQIALVALFSEMLYRFPNVVVAQVTRESVQQAIANGITAQQIIHFLRTRAHSVMHKQTPVLPPTITDQIRLWELERDRLQFTEGVLYNQFLSQADFEVLRDRAQGLGCLVWQDVAHRVMVVTPQGHSEVKRFWKRQKSHT
ncbi:general transcription factor IIH subunit 4 [Seriola lalandi dorsalis]|uniref:general transcription factor IIH subunit 4 n=1 Tax=Seriola lalandi dorsalis TaxID=1841481 RepID=UPI000C6FB51E|nr:general transcription factor IIH subunit 4 [Seriola lalandi dorsalis]